MKKIILALVVIVAACSQQPVTEDNNSEIKVDEDGTKFLVPEGKIIEGGPPKDGIPSIDNPDFIVANEVDWLKPNDEVLAIDYQGVQKAYPLKIMTWHEIVNDEINNTPLAITYCPLCRTGIAYHRKIQGKTYEFGVSGKLYNSNLVMYDRQTDSLWSQVEGLAIRGPMTGTELKAVGVDTVTWKEWKTSHPQTLVLSKETGYNRPYDKDPYTSYFNSSNVMFPLDNEDDRLYPKDVVYGIEVNGTYKAYPEKKINQTLKDTIKGVKIRVEKQDDGQVKFINENTNTTIPPTKGFWFAWVAFHPDTELMK